MGRRVFCFRFVDVIRGDVGIWSRLWVIRVSVGIFFIKGAGLVSGVSRLKGGVVRVIEWSVLVGSGRYFAVRCYILGFGFGFIVVLIRVVVRSSRIFFFRLWGFLLVGLKANCG